MHEHPCEPGDEAFEAHCFHIDYGFVAADGGHRAFVPIGEGFHLFAFELAADVFA